jgi:ABC-2 type transport system permease protein
MIQDDLIKLVTNMNVTTHDNINWFGAYTLTGKEILRFLRVYHQTIIAPIVSAMIFLAIFHLSIGAHKHSIHNVPFLDFMGYGLIMMSMIQNAFGNSSSSLIMSKMIGYIVDLLVPPLRGIEIVTAYIIGSVTRAIIIGTGVAIAMSPFIGFYVYHPLLLVFFVLASAMLMAKLGILAGLIANSFDQMAALTNYVIMPLSFLSGTFYSVKSLPMFLQYINHINPFFYIIDGFRYCLTDVADSNISVGVMVLIVGNLAMFYLVTHLINVGWRLKS